ncbi:MAG: hypothetical protein K6F50_08675 [Kiritimatiellae bacterium]|nr:hypothetical protein [Kiritimatiellia bacterium]
MAKCLTPEEIWQLIKEQEASGKSKTAFAAERGISAHRMRSYVRNRFKYDPRYADFRPKRRSANRKPKGPIRSNRMRRFMCAGILFYENRDSIKYVGHPLSFKNCVGVLKQNGYSPNVEFIRETMQKLSIPVVG